MAELAGTHRRPSAKTTVKITAVAISGSDVVRTAMNEIIRSWVASLLHAGDHAERQRQRNHQGEHPEGEDAGIGEALTSSRPTGSFVW